MSIGVSEASLSDIAAVTNNRNNDGMFGNDWAWIVILLLFGWGRNGFGFGGGYGNGCGNNCGDPCATQADVRAAVDQQTLISKIDQQTYGLADSFTALNNTLNNNFRSLPTRGAWIEMKKHTTVSIDQRVAPHAGSVDRNVP